MKGPTIAFIGMLFSLVAGTASATQSIPAKPNIIIILMDDMGYGDIAPFGSKLNRTPNLDRLAAEGTKLTSFYAAPVCSASRAQMMTGCYSKRVGLSGVLFPAGPKGLNCHELTIAEVLKQQGYSTMIVGKWHLGDQVEFLPTKHGFDHYFGLPYSNDMGGDGKPRQLSNGKTELRPPLPLVRDDKVIEAPVDQEGLTKRFAQEAVQFIKANKDRPFFLYLAHIAVHVPLYPGKEFQGKSANGAYGDWVEEADASVGQVIQTLRKNGLEKNTLVVFTSDNGPWLSKGKQAGVSTPLRGGKFTCWEGGMRVPTIAWWPGQIPAGKICDVMLSEMDLLPTAGRLARAELPKDRVIDGKDAWPVISGQSNVSPHEALFYWEGVSLVAVRSGDWKLLIRPQKEMENDKLPPGPFAPKLFNVASDLGETSDLAGQHPEIVQKLQGYIDEMDKDLGVKGEKAPGIRPAGLVVDPKLLLLRTGVEYD